MADSIVDISAGRKRLFPRGFWKSDPSDPDEKDREEDFEIEGPPPGCWDVWGTFILVCIGFLIFFVVLIVLVFTLPIKSYVNVARTWMKQQNPIGGPFLFLVGEIAVVMLFLPSSLFELIGILIFGPYIGWAINFTANMVAAVASFFIARSCLKEWVRRTARSSPSFVVGLRAIQLQPWTALLAIRFLFIPTGIKNYALGAVPMTPFWIYFTATLVATIVFVTLNAVAGVLLGDLILDFGSHAPSPIEIAVLTIGLAAFVGLFFLFFWVSQRVFDDMKNELDREEERERLVADRDEVRAKDEDEESRSNETKTRTDSDSVDLLDGGKED